ncbi:MAG: 4-alpha-glucanotransferase [Candidatus Nanopelagicales bacterium]|nr:4-alpha-glucanotransferase [Candidatus Nanopelagicales bacterium]
MSARDRLATSCGVATEYWDLSGALRVVPESTVEATLAALGVSADSDDEYDAALADRRRDHWSRALPALWVVREQDTNGPWVHHPEGKPPLIWVELEEGGRRYDLPCEPVETHKSGDVRLTESRILLPPDLPMGWHRLWIQQEDAERFDNALVVAPRRLPETPRGWGLAVQLYSVRSSRSWGLGDLEDLADVGVWAADELGADFVLVNPLHAAALVDPMENSPYLPATRRFGHPIYIRPEKVEEHAYLSREDTEFVAGVAQLLRAGNSSGELLDRDSVWRGKRAALEKIFEVPRSPARKVAFASFLAEEGEDLQAYARWCALAEEFGPRWDEWPEEASRFEPEDVRVEFYAWLQWIFDEQLDHAQRELLRAGMKIGIIQDLAIGVHPFGADTWAMGDLLTRGFRVGAPPDMFSPAGQDWSQPPWNPVTLEQAEYLPFRDILRYVMRHAGGLRIDHVIGLFRLWWIPPGADAVDGTYVRYDHEALIDILCLEAVRAGVSLIGEDLGTVEPWAREVLSDRGILGTTVLLFERDGDSIHDPNGWRTECLASVTVHDLPPTAQYLSGSHIRLWQELGLPDRPVEEALEAHDREVDTWVRVLRDEGLLSSSEQPSPTQITVAMHRLMSRAPSRLLCLSLVDGVGETRTQNQPGTDTEYPNWRLPLTDGEGRAVLIEELDDSELLRTLVRSLSR